MKNIIIETVLKLVVIAIKKLLVELKEMPLWEKAIVIGLFIIPIPFTMEGYFGVRTIIRKVVVKC